MKQLILVLIIGLTHQSWAQETVKRNNTTQGQQEKVTRYVPAHPNLNSESMPLMYDTRTTRLEIMIKHQPESRDTSTVSQTLKATPNPTSEYVILEYKLETDGAATIHILDIRGITHQILDAGNRHDQITLITRDWVPGIYIASLKVNGKLIESTKFTVIE